MGSGNDLGLGPSEAAAGIACSVLLSQVLPSYLDRPSFCRPLGGLSGSHTACHAACGGSKTTRQLQQLTQTFESSRRLCDLDPIEEGPSLRSVPVLL
eukprot:3940585-Rhodomonas_salina.4